MIKKILAISILATMLLLMGDINVMANTVGPLHLDHIMSWRAFAERRTCKMVRNGIAGARFEERCRTERVPTSNCQVEFYRSRGLVLKKCGEHIFTGAGQEPNPVLDATPGCLIIRQGGIPPQTIKGAPTPQEPSPFEKTITRKPDVGWPYIAGQTLDENSVISNLSSYLYNFIVSLAGILVFGSLVFAGFQYLTSAGDTNKMNDAKSRINSAFLGLLFIFISFIILNTINPQLTTFPEFDITKLEKIVNLHPDVRDALDQPPCTSIEFYNLANYGINKDGNETPGLMTVTLDVPALGAPESPKRLVTESIRTGQTPLELSPKPPTPHLDIVGWLGTKSLIALNITLTVPPLTSSESPRRLITESISTDEDVCDRWKSIVP